MEWNPTFSGLAAARAAGLALTASLAVAQAQAGTAPAVTLRAQGLRAGPGEITLSACLTNRAASELGTAVVEIDLPPGATQPLVLTTPAGSIVDAADYAVRWRVGRVPAFSILGPFAVRVSLDTSGGGPLPERRASVSGQPVSLVRARVRWETPAEGHADAPMAYVEDATQPEAAAVLRTGPLGAVPGTGIGFFVPAGDRGQVTLRRLGLEPPSDLASGQAWLAMYAVDQQKTGSLILTVPLRQPARPHALVRVFLDQGKGFHEQTVRGSVTRDGLHAAFAADGTGTYALGVDGKALDDLVVSIDPVQLKLTGMDEDLAFVESLTSVGFMDALLALLLGMTEAGQGSGGTGGSGPGGLFTWSEVVGFQSDDPEGGHTNPCGGTATPATTLTFDDGSTEVACTNGSVYECNSAGVCHQVAGGHFFPGPCPVLVCLMDTNTGEMFPFQDALLPASIGGLFELQDTMVRAGAPPAAGGTSLDATAFQAVVDVVGTDILTIYPGGQPWQIVSGLSVPKQ